MMTPEERKVLEALAEAFDLFCALPQLPLCIHDLKEFMTIIHAAQNMVLAREGMRAMAAFEAEKLRSVLNGEQGN